MEQLNKSFSSSVECEGHCPPRKALHARRRVVLEKGNERSARRNAMVRPSEVFSSLGLRIDTPIQGPVPISSWAMVAVVMILLVSEEVGPITCSVRRTWYLRILPENSN